jgi:HD-GYP domain-containing protein (c-di-GMP phosphodiesterase class II)
MDYISVANFADEILSRKDPYNHHGSNVSVMCMKIASRTKMSQDDMLMLYNGARLHDVGKVLLPDVLLNYPRRLTYAEYADLKNHVTNGYDIASALNYDPALCEMILCHQEHWDGSGYPRGLKGTEIPLCARIICVADVWDAITNDRAYHKAMPFEVALEEMNRCASWFDPELYAHWLELVRKDDHNQT